MRAIKMRANKEHEQRFYENKLLMPMLEGLGFKAKYFVGDAYHGKVCGGAKEGKGT